MKQKEARQLYAEGRTEELFDLRHAPGGLEGVVEKITAFIKEKTFGQKIYKGIIGISGGVDSALVAALAAQAIYSGHIFGLVMPSDTTTKEETEDAITQANALGITTQYQNIQGIVDAFGKHLPDVPWGEGKPSTLGNAKPRIRMTLLYGWANDNHGLVIGTDNKTEGTDFGMGYFTKYGDGGVDINPIGGLYKTQVWQLAKHLGVLQSIIDRKPTAGLFLGQTDEGELGVPYKTLDKILLGFELGMDQRTIALISDVTEEKVSELFAYRMKNQHKGAVPPSVTVVNYEN